MPIIGEFEGREYTAAVCSVVDPDPPIDNADDFDGLLNFVEVEIKEIKGYSLIDYCCLSYLICDSSVIGTGTLCSYPRITSSVLKCQRVSLTKAAQLGLSQMTRTGILLICSYCFLLSLLTIVSLFRQLGSLFEAKSSFLLYAQYLGNKSKQYPVYKSKSKSRKK